MDGLHIVLLLLSGVVSYGHGPISGSVLEVTVQPGGQITLYCDCKKSTGVHIVWYRNCSHEKQPSLVLQVKSSISNAEIYPRFHFVSNYSSNSSDLLIMNITDLDEGLYYCGTEQLKVDDTKFITSRNEYTYGNIRTRIKLNSSQPVYCEPNYQTPRDCDLCYRLLFSLCPTSAVLSAVVTALVVYHLCRKTAKDPQVNQPNPESRRQRLNKDEDVCYAALEIRQPSKRPKKLKTQTTDFSTYSAINTSRM